MKTMKNGRLRTAVSRMLAVVMTVMAVLSYPAIPVLADTYGKNGMVREMSSQELVRDMGLGYNLGNTFDSIGSFIGEVDPWNYQRGWGNEVLTRQFIHKVKEGGFRTIRFPVSWAQWIDENNQVDSGYLDAIQTVVDWVMEEDMYCILNVHHDGGYADTSWIHNAVTDYEGTLRKYTSLWNQIASRFQGYGDHLIFESMNEIEFPGAGMSRQYELLNSFNQSFVDTVRATGGTNEKRHLLIAGYNTDIKKTCDKRFQMPDDPTGRCILSIHYYSPSPFCVATHDVDWCTPDTDWGTEEDIAAVYADLDLLAERFLSKGTPIIIGEYGVLTEDNKDVESVRKYLRTVPEIIMQYGMCPVLWDVSNAGDMKTIERTTGEFYDPAVKAGYQQLSAMAANGQVERKVFQYPDYKEVKVPVSPDGWVSLTSFEPSKIAGVRFSLTCASDWDSYGGGGIYLDSWDNTIQYQFNSPYEEVTHMFTAEERARLKDQISIAIWWTDESQGGNRRDELSIAGGQVTLLYEEGTSVGVVGARTSGGGGSSGGGGGSSGGGTSSRPNYSTKPGETTDNPGPDKYSYSLTASRNGAPDGDDRTGVYYLDLEAICPEYQDGDEVRITVTPYSDGGYSYALVDTSLGYGDASDSFGTAGSWTVTPGSISDERKAQGYGQIGLYLWYLEKNYFLFNVDVEVTKKAPTVEPVMVAAGEELAVDLSAYLEAAGLRAGQRVKLTVYVAPDGVEAYSGKVSLTEDSGTVLRGFFNGENGETGQTSVIGTVGDDLTVTVALDAASEAGQVEVTRISVEACENDVLAELPTYQSGEVTLSGTVLAEAFAKDGGVVEGERAGLKIYYTGVADKNWSSGFLSVDGSSDWEAMSDDQGDYLWIDDERITADTLPESLTIYDNQWSGESFCVVGIVAVTAAEIPDIPDIPDIGDEEVLEVTVSADEDGRFYAPQKDGVLAGVRITTDLSGGWNDENGWFGWFGSGDSYSMFPDGRELEYLASTESNPDLSNTTVTFLYWHQEEAEQTELDGNSNAFVLAGGRVPMAIWYRCGASEITDYGKGTYVDLYTRASEDENWSRSDNLTYYTGVRTENETLMMLEEGQKEKLASYVESGKEVLLLFGQQADDKDSPISRVVGYYEKAAADEAAVSPAAVEMEAETLDRNLFRLPALNAPVGMRYEAQIATESDAARKTAKTSEATVRMATASDWGDLEEASPSNWTKAASGVPVKADREMEVWFTPKQVEAILRKVYEAEEESVLPLVYLDIREPELDVKKLYFLYDPEEILNVEYDSEGGE